MPSGHPEKRASLATEFIHSAREYVWRHTDEARDGRSSGFARLTPAVNPGRPACAGLVRSRCISKQHVDDLPASEACQVCGRAVPILYIRGPWWGTSADS